MLLDPLEEQFHLPAVLVERADGSAWQCHLVGEEDERLAGFGVFESNTAQMNGVVLLRVEAVERNGLIANDAGWPICFRRIDAMEVHVRLGPRDEESAGQMQNVKASEIDVATIHDVDGTGLGYQQVERMHIVQLAVGNMNEARNAATQVEQRMHLHCGLGRAEVCPRKDRQAQVDGRGVECINRVRQVQPQVLAGIQCSGLTDQTLREVGIDALILEFVLLVKVHNCSNKVKK